MKPDEEELQVEASARTMERQPACGHAPPITPPWTTMRAIAILALVMCATHVFFAHAIIRQPILAYEEPVKGLRREAEYFIAPIGSASTIYSTYLNIGGERFRLIMDTGSGLTLVTGRNCTLVGEPGGCYYATNFYTGSGTLVDYARQHCRGSISYGDQSNRCLLQATYADGAFTQAVGVSEVTQIGEYSAQFTFGMMYAQSADMVLPNTDGIWGMGRYLPNYVSLPGPLDVLKPLGLPYQFAMCLTSSGGDLHLGGYDLSFSSTGSVEWFTYDAANYHYAVPLQSLLVGPTILPATYPVVFDSGSTISYIPHNTAVSMVQQIKASCATCNADIFLPGAQYQLIQTDPSTWPTIAFRFTNINQQTVTFTLTGSQYLRPAPGARGWYLPGFVNSSRSDILFGASFMKTWYTVFDVDNGRLGIGSVNAAKCVGDLPNEPPLQSATPATPKPPVTFENFVPVTPAPMAPVMPSPSPTPTSTPVSGPPVIMVPGDAPTNTASHLTHGALMIVAIACSFFAL